MKNITKPSNGGTLLRQRLRRVKVVSPAFTTVELLITLFIAVAFLTSGYQLYSLVIKNGGETRAQARASNVAYDYLQRYKTYAQTPCWATGEGDSFQLTGNDSISGLSNVTVTVVISCPYSETGTTSISKVLVTVTYNNPQKTITNATYATP